MSSEVPENTERVFTKAELELIEKSKAYAKKCIAKKRIKSDQKLIEKYGYLPEKTYHYNKPLISDEQRLAAAEKNRENARLRYQRIKAEKIKAAEEKMKEIQECDCPTEPCNCKNCNCKN